SPSRCACCRGPEAPTDSGPAPRRRRPHPRPNSGFSTIIVRFVQRGRQLNRDAIACQGAATAPRCARTVEVPAPASSQPRSATRMPFSGKVNGLPRRSGAVVERPAQEDYHPAPSLGGLGPAVPAGEALVGEVVVALRVDVHLVRYRVLGQRA